ncbi:hypothetical protein ACFWOB_35105 [Streptomyces sp. NPDC058420]|uniref:hypothetical protein n=1 Tax=Streptomyces sp. NPDC058420 TaxID=3346489 RepID=UPI0036557E31
MYDGTALHLSSADHPDTVIARASTCGFTTGPWEVTAYRASITSVEVWLRINPEYGDHLIDVSPFWPARTRHDRVHRGRRAHCDVPGDRLPDGASRPAPVSGCCRWVGEAQ